MDKPFSDTGYARFYSFAEILRDITQSPECYNLTGQKIFKNDNSRRLIEEKVGHLGFRRVSDDAHSGSFALVFEGTNHQMLRIISADSCEQARLRDWGVLQPLVSMKCKSRDNDWFTIELLPRVHTLNEIIEDKKLSKEYNLTKGDVPGIALQLFIYHLRKSNRIFYDPSTKNIGIVRDRKGNNVPVVIDPGAIVDRDKIDELLCPDARDTFREVLIRRCKYIPEFNKNFRLPGNSDGKFSDTYLQYLSEQPMPEYRFQEAQECHLERLGLEPGKANRVISDQDLKRFHDDRKDMVGTAYHPTRSVWTRMAKDDGFYPDEISVIMEAAAADSSGKGFCKKVEAAKRKYQKSLR